MNTEFLGSLYDLLPSCKELLNPLAMKLDILGPKMPRTSSQSTAKARALDSKYLGSSPSCCLQHVPSSVCAFFFV